MFKRYSSTLRKAPFRHAKWPISGAEKHHIAPWYGLNRMMKWALSESKMNDSGLWYRVYEKGIQAEMDSQTLNLTFLHTSFPNLFCQNNVKKNCKLILRVFHKNADVRCDESHKKHLLEWPEASIILIAKTHRLCQREFIGCCNIKSLFIMTCHVAVYATS